MRFGTGLKFFNVKLLQNSILKRLQSISEFAEFCGRCCSVGKPRKPSLLKILLILFLRLVIPDPTAVSPDHTLIFTVDP